MLENIARHHFIRHQRISCVCEENTYFQDSISVFKTYVLFIETFHICIDFAEHLLLY